VALVRTDVSDELLVSIISAKIIEELRKIRCSETSVLRRVIRRQISGDGVLHRHLRENLKS
jgi:hypothetical protein